mgnify:CR=1 FL=1
MLRLLVEGSAGIVQGEKSGGMPSESEVVLKINKTDWQTEVGLEGCMVDIFENGAWIGVVTTDEDGEATFTVKKSKEEFEKNNLYIQHSRAHSTRWLCVGGAHRFQDGKGRRYAGISHYQ